MRFRAHHVVLPLLVLLAAACGDDDSSAQTSDPGRPRGVDASDAPRPIDGVTAPDFDGGRAFSLIETQVGFGPRVAGTPGHVAQLAWMTALLREAADTVIAQPFVHVTAAGVRLPMSNLFARFRPDASERILLLAHWDTRSVAEMEPDASRRDEPILGANDGASGTALLLHLAELLGANPPPIGVDILLTDGEDYLPGERDMYLGAKHFAANLPVPGYRPRYGVLVDMIADSDPVYPVEAYSAQHAPDVIRRVYALAHELGYGPHFPLVQGGGILDDHIPLNQAGIPTIDIIDFNFGPGNSLWHTHADDVSAVSVRGLEAVGTVLTELIYRGG
jgi:Zn-dependent M28 family amino/carboxypeptidase